MHNKLTTLAVALTATAGAGLAVAIPTASAQKAHAVYCEGSTTPYSQYTSCPPTTTTTSSTPTKTTTTTSTAPATTTTSATVTTPATPDLSTLTQSQAYQYLATLAGVTVSKTGLVSISAAGSSLPVGIALAPGCSVISNANGMVTINDNGVTFNVPYGAQVTVSVDGVANVFTDGVSQTFTAARLSHASVKATKMVEQFVVLPTGRTSNKVSYVLPKGVSFGKNTTWAKIATYFKFYGVSNTKMLGTSKAIKASVVKVSATAANKGRTAVTFKLAKAQKSYAIYFNLKGLQTSKSAKNKTLKATFSTYSTVKGQTSKDTSSFTYVS